MFFLGGTTVTRYPLFADLTVLLVVAMLVIGVVETSGFISFAVGVRNAGTSVVATIASAYALVPVSLGFLILAERPAANQWAGIGLVTGGVILLGTTA